MFTIGSLEIAHPFTLAALSGYSDPAMRRVARRFGASYAVNEVVLDRTVLHDGGWQRSRLLTVDADDHPVGAQLMGSVPEHFAPAAAKLADAGYDVIDINFGCPVPKALGRCRGGYLLAEPDTALEIVGRVIDAVGDRRPVTVKMRRGLDDSAESKRRFFQILDGAFELGAAAITVHGRTVEQRYKGPSDGRFLAEVKRHAGSRTIIGSGDLMSAEACLRVLQETGVDGLALARGAIGNPWLFRDCLATAAGEALPAALTVAEQGEVIRAHWREVCERYGAKAAKVFQKDAMRYAKLHPATVHLRRALHGAATVEKLSAVIESWYAPSGATSSQGARIYGKTG